MSEEVRLAADAEAALGAAQRMCYEMNVAIVAPEHVLAGALMVLGQSGHGGVPPLEAIEVAVMASQGAGDTALDSNVMFGSGAREAINFVALVVRRSGETNISAGHLAAGTILSGEVGPMFFSALGTTRDGLLEALASGEPD
jgi:hypothetical protein